MTDDWDSLDDKLGRFEDMADLIESERAGMVCEVMRTVAVNLITDQHAVDTGRLRASVGADNNEIIVRGSKTSVTMGIDCPVEYGIFIEYGTGPKGDPAIPHTSKEKWYQHNPDYQGEPGKNNDPRNVEAFGQTFTIPEFIVRYAQHPRPFMRPALYNNIDVYKDILEGVVTEVFE